MAHPLHSARERLKRADENIRNLNSEVNLFLQPFPRIAWKGQDPVFTDADQKTFNVLREHAKSGNELPRFRVLAGEIVHHLRCAFDHVVWQLSSPEARTKFGSKIEFPVETALPECVLNTNGVVKHSIYCRKVKGVTSLTALARIEALQPYKRPDPKNSPLLFIHDLDRFAKHRELNIVIPNIALRLRASTSQTFRTVKNSATGGIQLIGVVGPRKMEVNGELSAQVVFAEFSGVGDPLIKFLNNLLSFTSNSVESFAVEFP
jgi:hypothetical protein